MSEELRIWLRSVCVRMALETGDEGWLKVSLSGMFTIFGTEQISTAEACQWLKDNYYEPASVPV